MIKSVYEKADNDFKADRLSVPPPVQREIDYNITFVNHLEEAWPEGIRFSDGVVSVYYCFPYLFSSAFPTIPTEQLRQFSAATRLFASSIFLCDRVYDGSVTASSRHRSTQANVLNIVALQAETYRLLHGLFPPDTIFWDRFHQYLRVYMDACTQEKLFLTGATPWQTFTPEIAFEIAVGKSSVARAVIAGLVGLANDDTFFHRLVEAVDQHNLAHQLWDDFRDWKEDLHSGTPSLLLRRLFENRPVFDTPEQYEQLTKKVGYEIFYGGHGRYMLELALEALDRSDELTDGIPDLIWHHINADLRRHCQNLLDDIERIVKRNLHRARKQPSLSLPMSSDPWQQLAWHALDYVMQQWHLGFGEARHIMGFPHSQGFTGDDEYQYGDVFQRAIITDVLCDADVQLNGQLQSLLENEIAYLLSQHYSDVGGWSYFPGLPEQPPDADDLAQIMQVLIRCQYIEEVNEYCQKPLKTLFEDNSHADGSFETWIIPSVERTPTQTRQAEFVDLAWGSGPDNEVIANLLYALTLYDVRYFERVGKGIHFLEGRQETDGSWLSTWYHGPFYGTYVCLRLLTAVTPNSAAIQAAQQFLRHQQHNDGGWGVTEKSDPLSTALALLGLGLKGTPHHICPDDIERARQALTYLQQSKAKDNGWESVDFIRMEMGRATGNVLKVLSYGSRTITTAYVLKASLLWQQLCQTFAGS